MSTKEDRLRWAVEGVVQLYGIPRVENELPLEDDYVRCLTLATAFRLVIDERPDGVSVNYALNPATLADDPMSPPSEPYRVSRYNEYKAWDNNVAKTKIVGILEVLNNMYHLVSARKAGNSQNG